VQEGNVTFNDGTGGVVIHYILSRRCFLRLAQQHSDTEGLILGCELYPNSAMSQQVVHYVDSEFYLASHEFRHPSETTNDFVRLDPGGLENTGTGPLKPVTPTPTENTSTE
jgi:hypothetical protein